MNICPACRKEAIRIEARKAELPPNKDKYRQFIAIGKIYYHKDQTVCDETLYKIEKVRQPTFLREIGNDLIDHRT